MRKATTKLESVQSQTKVIPMTQINDLLTKGLIDIDPAFQANEFGTRWTPAHQSSYMSNAIRGMAPSPYILCDVKRSLDLATEKDYISDMRYFQGWLNQGTSYLNIDSNNRCGCTQQFFKGKVSLMEGEYSWYDDEGDRVVVEVTKGNKNFKNLSKTLRDHIINDVNVAVTVIATARRDQLSEMFFGINDGVPLNNPEQRNCFTSNIASVIRESAREYRDFFKSWYKGTQINRRVVDDFLMSLAMIDYGISNDIRLEKISCTAPAKLDAVYTDSMVDKNTGKFAKRLKKFMSFVMKHDRLKDLAKINSIFDLYVIYAQICKSHNEFRFAEGREEKFVDTYVKSVGKAMQDPREFKVSEGTSKSFDFMLGGQKSLSNYHRNDIIRDHMTPENYFIEIDKKRSLGDRNSMFVQAVNQDFTTPGGKVIEPGKLHTSDYHAGHIEPHSQGGKTTMENMAVQTAEENLKLGAKAIAIE